MLTKTRSSTSALLAPHVLDKLVADFPARAFQSGRTFAPIEFDFRGELGVSMVATREDFIGHETSLSVDGVPMRSKGSERWTNILTRLIRARTVLAIERARSDGVLDLRERVLTIIGPDGPVGIPALLIGGGGKADDKVTELKFILEHIVSIMQVALAYEPDLSTSVDFNARLRNNVHGIIPVPGPSAGWAFFHDWMIVFMTKDEFQTGEIRNGVQLPSIEKLLNTWLDKSEAWAKEGGAVDRFAAIRSVRANGK